MVPAPAALILPHSLLETQILRSHQRTAESEILGVGLSNLCFAQALQVILSEFKFENELLLYISGLHKFPG